MLLSMQIAALTRGELQWLANHMGHELNIHETVYRLQDHTIELAKVSRLLMAVDDGTISAYRGKTLDDILMTGEQATLTDIYTPQQHREFDAFLVGQTFIIFLCSLQYQSLIEQYLVLYSAIDCVLVQ